MLDPGEMSPDAWLTLTARSWRSWSLPLRSPSRERIIDSFLDRFKVPIADSLNHFGKNVLCLVLDPNREVTAPRVVVSRHFCQARGFATGDPVANARHGI